MSVRSVLFLAEVYLGKTAESGVGAALPPGYHSIKGVGSQQPGSAMVTVDSGLRIPMGPLQSMSRASGSYYSYSLNYNEFIVFNPAQIRLRYMVVVKKARFDLQTAAYIEERNPLRSFFGKAALDDNDDDDDDTQAGALTTTTAPAASPSSDASSSSDSDDSDD